MANDSIRVLAHAKINWVLNVCARREDGYHILDMLVQRIDLHDVLQFSPAKTLQLEVAGSPEGLQQEDNLVMRAARALKQATGHPGGARMQLQKHIPEKAGLGGGSADAAAALMGLNRLWGTGLSITDLQDIGLPLGADIPLCLCPGLMRVKGIGEEVARIPQAPAYPLLILQSGHGLSTAEVFRRHDLQPDAEPARLDLATDALLQQDVEGILAHCKNQLQPTAASMLADIGDAVMTLQDSGAAFAQMTGSGSAVFGVFETKEAAATAQTRLKDAWPVCIQTMTLAG